MKRIARAFLIVLSITLMLPPLMANAAKKKNNSASKLFKTVTLNTQNFTEYFGIKKQKRLDSFGDYDGYEYVFYSKMKEKGYYVYSVSPDYAMRYNFSNYHEETNSDTGEVSSDVYEKKDTESTYLDDTLDSWNKNNNFDAGKITAFEILKLKGKIIFVNKKNIKKIDKKNDRILLKSKYNKKTYYTYDGKKQIFYCPLHDVDK